MIALAAAVPGFDVHDYVHGVVEGVLGLTLPDTELRRQLGVRAVSRIAGSGTGWYLWTAGQRGALEISLPPGVAGAVDAAVPLAVRYFPDPGEAAFVRHSRSEQDLRRSSRFDRTGTPAFESRDDIDPGLFHVGVLELVPRPAAQLDLRLHAQERWVDDVEIGGDRTRVRDVPGLRVARIALDVLACALAYVGRQAPARVRVWRQPGTIRSTTAGGSVAHVPGGDFSAWLVEVGGLRAPGELDAWRGEPLPGVGEAPCLHHTGTEPPRPARWPVNPAWWAAADWRFAPTGSFCAHCVAEAEPGPGSAHRHHACCNEGDHDHGA